MNTKNLIGLMCISAMLELNNPYAASITVNRKYKKPLHKCLRKSCNILTSHNGGYCSAECCKLDRQGL